MTVEYIVSDRGSFVYARADGVLTETDFLKHERALSEDAEVRCRYRHLLDVRHVTEHSVDSARLLVGLKRLLQATPKIRGSRCAVVAHDSWWFDVGFQRQCESHGLTLIAFNDPATACVWLGVSYAQLLHEAAGSSCLMSVGTEAWPRG
jgi:hypothetical protein